MEWERRSQRLWTADADGRHFRIERSSSARGTGPVQVREMDRLHRELRREYAKGFPAAQAVAEGWLDAGEVTA